MSITISNKPYRGGGHDHFEPEAFLDPVEQRKLRGHLEQIDYVAFAANRELLGQALGPVGTAVFQRLAVAAAQARAQWVSAATGPPRTFDVKSDGMDPPASFSAEVAGRSLPPRMALEEDER